MADIAPEIACIDTLIADRPGVTAAFLVRGDQPALIDTGPQTCAETVRAALASEGIGPGDLAWIVLTHIHLDHCGASGDLARAFPNATVVVHERGARHLIDPSRLVPASHAVYGVRSSIYGGLTPIAAERIVVAPDGFRVQVGNGRYLEMLTTPGHAKHHMSVVADWCNTVIAGDAVGIRMLGGGLYPALPPADVDIAAARASVALLAERRPDCVAVSHFGVVGDDPAATLALADEQLRRSGEAAVRGWLRNKRDGVAEEIARDISVEAAVASDDALAAWRWFTWDTANTEGLSLWAERETAPAST